MPWRKSRGGCRATRNCCAKCMPWSRSWVSRNESSVIAILLYCYIVILFASEACRLRLLWHRQVLYCFSMEKKYLTLNDLKAYTDAFQLSNEVWDIVAAWK